MLSILVTYAINASIFYVQKLLLQFFSPFWLAGISTFISGLLLFSYEYIVRHKRLLPPLVLIKKLAPAALCIMYGAVFLRIYALTYISPTLITIFGVFDPFIAALLGYFLKDECLSNRQIFGMLIATVGVVPLLASKASFTVTAQAGFAELLSLPALAGFLSVLVNRYGWLLLFECLRDIRKHTEGSFYSIEYLTALMMFIGSLFSLSTAVIVEPQMAFTYNSFFVVAMLMYLATSTSICGVLYATLVHKHGVTLLALTEFFNPMFAAFYGWLFFKEPITLTFIVSSIVILMGLCTFSYGKLKVRLFKWQKN